MGLSVYLKVRGVQNLGDYDAVLVREDGALKELSWEEWQRRFPGRSPVMVTLPSDDEYVYDANITHNLGAMADAAGIYEACWRPEEIGITKASQLAPLLRAGLEKLRADPEKFKALNPPNGWGSYDGFVPWVERYLAACEAHPDAEVSVSR